MAWLDVPGPRQADHDVPLLEAEVASDPLEQFRRWYAEAAAVVRVPEAAAVASADASGSPSVRMVLVKQIDATGFTFYTNTASRKGSELLARPAAALLFYWDPLGRQVRVEGSVHEVEASLSDAYFSTRPRGSQLSAHASSQSEPIQNRQDLEAAVAAAGARFAGRAVPRPAEWGGLCLEPRRIEFWQNRGDRLHDRLVYETMDGSGWSLFRLQP